MPYRSLIVVLVLALVLALAGSAAGRTTERGIELADGSGRALVSLRGAVLGLLEQGRLTVITLGGNDRPHIFVDGFTWVRRTGESTIYGGRNIRFRVFRGAWRIRLVGRGINASAVGNGVIGLRGTGRYALSGGDFVPWPDVYQTIKLG